MAEDVKCDSGFDDKHVYDYSCIYEGVRIVRRRLRKHQIITTLKRDVRFENSIQDAEAANDPGLVARLKGEKDAAWSAFLFGLDITVWGTEQEWNKRNFQ